MKSQGGSSSKKKLSLILPNWNFQTLLVSLICSMRNNIAQFTHTLDKIGSWIFQKNLILLLKKILKFWTKMKWNLKVGAPQKSCVVNFCTKNLAVLIEQKKHNFEQKWNEIWRWELLKKKVVFNIAKLEFSDTFGFPDL